MKKEIALLFFLNLLFFYTSAQDLDLNKKQTKAFRTNQAISIDGLLSEDDWLRATPTSDFIVNEPNPGTKPAQRTEVKIMYDNTGLYVGAMLYDSKPDSILKELSQRDQFGNTDWFGIFLDPYRDGINGVSFIVTPAGVQFDAKYSVFGEDENWDAVWESATNITDQGWVVEMKIPYSAIRFPDMPIQTWHLNFGRMIRRIQQKSFWSEVDPQKNGFLNQAGYLMGIEDIKSPVRLSATPFIAVYGQHYHDKEGDPINSYGRSFNGGMDIKYGISDAFTLDMTLIPDFGEAQSDNQVLNLSPFEVRFDENRQFFTEGTELFNKGGLFYSRRVGGTPLHYYDVYDQMTDDEEVIENPQQTQLYNATKISGRNKNGLGIGLFNATSGRTTALLRNSEGIEREIQTDPLTNYNVFVLDQNLKNNSYVTFINTTVLRSGSDYDANVTGTVFSLRNKKNTYEVRGSGALSQKYFTNDTDLGHKYNLSFRKTSGNLIFGLFYGEESDTYDPNDLGFLYNNNERGVEGWVEYNAYKPFWKFNRAGGGLWMQYSMLYNPSVFTDYGINTWFWGETKNFWNLNFFTYHEPFVTYDYFEPRTEGRYYRVPTSSNYGFYIGSDRRKRLRVSMNANFRTFSEEGRVSRNYFIEPRFRVNDKLSFTWELGLLNNRNSIGYVNDFIDEKSNEHHIIFGRRDQNTVINELGSSYNFNNKMALTFRLRHYWSKVKYNRFNLLLEDGGLGYTDYQDIHDANFNAFNIDMVYRWRFAPGSDIFVVWKNAIFNSSDIPSVDYFDNVNKLFESPQTNSLSIKVIYFLDYLNLVKNK